MSGEPTAVRIERPLSYLTPWLPRGRKSGKCAVGDPTCSKLCRNGAGASEAFRARSAIRCACRHATAPSSKAGRHYHKTSGSPRDALHDAVPFD